MVLNFFQKTVTYLEKTKTSFLFWGISFLSLISIRLLVESLLLGFPERNWESFSALFIHTFLFFLLTYLTFLFFLMFLTKEKFKKIANFLLWGFVIIIFPPIIDKVVFQGDVYKSFYLFDSFQGLVVRFFSFFGENPDWGITWGTRVNILIALVFLSVYVFIKTKNWKKVLGMIFGGYVLFFLLSSFPSLVVFVLEFFEKGGLNGVTYSLVASYFLTSLDVFHIKGVVLDSFLARKLALIYLPLVFVFLTTLSFKIDFLKTLSLVKNIRYPQLVFGLGLLFIGMGMGNFFNLNDWDVGFFEVLVLVNLVLMVFSAWFFSVFINDLSDIKIDQITNRQRPLIKKTISKKEFKNYAGVFFVLSILSAALISPVVLLIVLSYHFLTFIYSCFPFRLKRFPGVSNGLISLASLNFLIIGFLVFSENQTLGFFPWKIYWFLFLAYFLIIPLKDLKDFRGDKKDDVYTWVVLLGKEKAKLFIASALLSFYFLSVYILNQQKLFLSALIFGVLSFYLITRPQANERRLIVWVLGLSFLYGLWLVKIVF